jgi:hypothetical protein
MKRPNNGTTPQQYAYATRLLGGQGTTKKEIALMAGYPPSIANNASTKIEKTEGFQNAVIKLATESNNLVLNIMAEYKARGFKKFSNKDLNGAINAISQAWDRFNKQRAPDQNRTPEGNPLRKVIMQKIENQTINNISAPKEIEEPEVIDIPEEDEEEDIDLDF